MMSMLMELQKKPPFIRTSTYFAVKCVIQTEDIRTIRTENICCYSKHESTTLGYILFCRTHVVMHVWNIYCIKPIKRNYTFFNGKSEGRFSNESCFQLLLGSLLSFSENKFSYIQMFRYSMHNQKRSLLCCFGWLKLLCFRVSQVFS